MKALLATLAGALVLGCAGPEPEPPASDAAPSAPAEDGGVLLKMDFDVELVYGDFSAETGDGVWTLSVSEKNSAKLVLVPKEADEAQEVFTASTEPTFDGLRFVINKVKGERKEAEAYFKAIEDGYELKNKRLLDDLDFPKTFKRSN